MNENSGSISGRSITWPVAALDLDPAQRHHHREGAVEPGDHVGERGRRQHRLAVGKAGARRIARHALDQGAEAGPVAVGPVLAPAGDAHDHQARVALVQLGRREAHLFERAGAEILDQHLGGRDQVEQQLAAARRAQAQRDALLVAGVELPVDADPVRLPGAQRVALAGILDLDDLGAEIGELRRDRVAGDEPRHVDDPDAVERAGGIGLERFSRHGHRTAYGGELARLPYRRRKTMQSAATTASGFGVTKASLV